MNINQLAKSRPNWIFGGIGLILFLMGINYGNLAKVIFSILGLIGIIYYLVSTQKPNLPNPGLLINSDKPKPKRKEEELKPIKLETYG